MNSDKGTRGKNFLMTVLSLGLMILGFGSVSWALLNIGVSSEASENISGTKAVESEQYKIPYILDVKSYNAKSDSAEALPNSKESIYPKDFKVGDKIGCLRIPALKRKIALIEGTGDKSLKKGAGHFAQSVMPGVVDNCVISGHRETVFKGIGKLKIGDTIIVETADGVFTYEVSGTRIVHKDDKTVIVPTESAVLTLTTCYPFNFVGDAPDRYIISADLVQ
jgi:sortase A